PHLGRIGHVESRGQHADDGVRDALQVEGAADHATVAAEAALPELAAEDRHRGSAGTVLVVAEEPAELRPDAERTQVRGGDPGAPWGCTSSGVPGSRAAETLARPGCTRPCAYSGGRLRDPRSRIRAPSGEPPVDSRAAGRLTRPPGGTTCSELLGAVSRRVAA